MPAVTGRPGRCESRIPPLTGFARAGREAVGVDNDGQQTFLPFSRRFELFLSVPFVSTNGTEDPNQGYRSDFGDISLAGSFLLSETEACTQNRKHRARHPPTRT
jgi:hypothetical protein